MTRSSANLELFQIPLPFTILSLSSIRRLAPRRTVIALPVRGCTEREQSKYRQWVRLSLNSIKSQEDS